MKFHSRKMHVMFATYLQNVTALPSKMVDNVNPQLEYCKSRVKDSDTHVHRIINCTEQ